MTNRFSNITEINDNDAPVELPHDYQITMKDGKEIYGKGFLAVAQTFAAIGNKSGDVSVVVPLSEIRVITEVERPVGSA